MAPPGNVLESTTFGPERQDRLMRRGLFAIQQVVAKEDADLLQFPVRLDGSTGLPLQVQEIFTQLIQGECLLASVAEPDAAAAQRYLEWLLLPQLLRMRCSHVNGQFLTKAFPVSFTRALDHRLTDTMAERLLGVEANLKTSRRLVRVVTLIYGVQSSMPGEETDWWSLRVGGERWFLSLSSCKLTRTAPTATVRCHRVLSVDRDLLKWQVCLVRDVDRWDAELCGAILRGGSGSPCGTAGAEAAPPGPAAQREEEEEEPEAVTRPHCTPSTLATPCLSCRDTADAEVPDYWQQVVMRPHSTPSTLAAPCLSCRDTTDAEAEAEAARLRRSGGGDAALRAALQAAEGEAARLGAEAEEAQKQAIKSAKTAEDEAKEREAKLRAELDEARSSAADAAALREEAKEIEDDALALFEENRRLMEVLCRLMEALGLAAAEAPTPEEDEEEEQRRRPPPAPAADEVEEQEVGRQEEQRPPPPAAAEEEEEVGRQQQGPAAAAPAEPVAAAAARPGGGAGATTAGAPRLAAAAAGGAEHTPPPPPPPRRRVEDLLGGGGGKRPSQKQADLDAPDRLTDSAVTPHFSRCATAGGG